MVSAVPKWLESEMQAGSRFEQCLRSTFRQVANAEGDGRIVKEDGTVVPRGELLGLGASLPDNHEGYQDGRPDNNGTDENYPDDNDGDMNENNHIKDMNKNIKDINNNVKDVNNNNIIPSPGSNTINVSDALELTVWQLRDAMLDITSFLPVAAKKVSREREKLNARFQR